MKIKTISATKARNNFSELLNLVSYKGEKFIINRKGKPIAALVPKAVIKKNWERATEDSPEDILQQLAETSLGIKSWEEVKKLLSDLHETRL